MNYVGSGHTLYNSTFKNEFFDSIVAQYKIGLETNDAITGVPEYDPLVEVYFLFATFFT